MCGAQTSKFHSINLECFILEQSHFVYLTVWSYIGLLQLYIPQYMLVIKPFYTIIRNYKENCGNTHIQGSMQT